MQAQALLPLGGGLRTLGDASARVIAADLDPGHGKATTTIADEPAILGKLTACRQEHRHGARLHRSLGIAIDLFRH
jgi:hypothetical protein